MVPGLSFFREFKSYYGLNKTEFKLNKWLSDFEFIDINEADERINWESVQVVRLG
jgi:hypothetical protein